VSSWPPYYSSPKQRVSRGRARARPRQSAGWSLPRTASRDRSGADAKEKGSQGPDRRTLKRRPSTGASWGRSLQGKPHRHLFDVGSWRNVSSTKGNALHFSAVGPPGARTNAGLRGDHAVAAFMFRAIKPLIGDPQKRIEGISIAPELRRPDADGHLCYPNYGALTSTPAGLSPAEHASLHWTHNRTGRFPASGSRTRLHAFACNAICSFWTFIGVDRFPNLRGPSPRIASVLN
jgi:hypothetical protein